MEPLIPSRLSKTASILRHQLRVFGEISVETEEESEQEEIIIDPTLLRSIDDLELTVKIND